VFLAMSDPGLLFADCLQYSKYLHHGGLAVANRRGQIIKQCNGSRLFIPASVLKIATALASIKILGEQYRFTTEFYFDPYSQVLTIKGFGDPLLVSEEVDRIVFELRKRGVSNVAGIIVDDSAFELEDTVPGGGESDNPYDAPVAATSVNFNTVAVKINPGGEVQTAEVQTPFVPLMGELGMGYGEGEYRLNICQGESNNHNMTARYTAELFFSIMQRSSISVNGSWKRGKVSDGANLLYRHRSSRQLSEVIALCLQYSNNFTANSLFLAAGARRYGYPATWEKGRRALNEILTELLGEEMMRKVHVLEGSGLSRENRISVDALLRILQLFRPYDKLLPVKRGVLLKSGTMRGVYSYAGYLSEGGAAFAILLNQAENTRDTLLDSLRPH
ncbi:MAG: D-alanyl-D-alanine carboxypeptidase, partial [Desulfobulbaceae bacterium]|nr:D-alanyl-D-alanine carboxypeptidase [Desulfobulbaceae bacterium]